MEVLDALAKAGLKDGDEDFGQISSTWGSLLIMYYVCI